MDNIFNVDFGPQWASTRVTTYTSDLYWIDPTSYPNVKSIHYVLWEEGTTGYIIQAENNIKTRGDGFTNEFKNLEKGARYRIQLVLEINGIIIIWKYTNWITIIDVRNEVNIKYSYLPRSNQVVLNNYSKVVRRNKCME